MIFSKNCSYYIAQALTASTIKSEFDNPEFFVTPVGTLRWARSNGLISKGTYSPSTQIRAINAFHKLSDNDQLITKNTLYKSANHEENNLSTDVESALSEITEYLIPREPDLKTRNYFYQLKKQFPSAKSLKIDPTDDPSKSIGSSSVSFTLLPQTGTSIISISPGFLNLDNESFSGMKNATVETFKTDVSFNGNAEFRVDQFHLIKTESNQPSYFLSDGFTQAIEVSYTDYRSYLKKNYKEINLLFGRGVSSDYFENIFSIIPLASIVHYWNDAGTSTDGRIEIRLRAYRHISESLSSAIQITQLLTPYSDIKQKVEFDMARTLGRGFTGSLLYRHIVGQSLSTTSLFGLKFSILY